MSAMRRDEHNREQFRPEFTADISGNGDPLSALCMNHQPEERLVINGKCLNNFNLLDLTAENYLRRATESADASYDFNPVGVQNQMGGGQQCRQCKLQQHNGSEDHHTKNQLRNQSV